MDCWALLLLVQPLLVASAFPVRLASSKGQSDPLPHIHFVYTVGCNDYQLTHAVVLEHSWRTAGNRGQLTRIVEGCTSKADEELLARSPLQGDSDFSVFFTKGDLEVIPRTGERYPARARPHALQQWLQEAKPSDQTLVALLDPDFLFLKNISDHDALRKIRPGRMLSAAGWEESWDGTNLKCQGTGSLELDLTCELKEADLYNASFAPEYKTGPVWFIFVQDLKAVLPGWQRFTDFWPKAGKGLMREQFALWRAAAMHNLDSDFEDLTRDSPDMDKPEEVPYIVHYFRTYGYKNWTFHKSYATSGWYAQRFSNTLREPLTCGAPLLQEPPGPPSAQEVDAWAIYTLMTHFNPAFMAYREIYCPGEADIFSRRGRTAFGLVRLLSPLPCQADSHPRLRRALRRLSRIPFFKRLFSPLAPSLFEKAQIGRVTRYAVDPAVPSSWLLSQALGGSPCSMEAQEIARVGDGPRHGFL